MTFKDWFFKEFPDFYQDNDVNKNVLGEGTFQRYLRTFGLELDEEMMPYIHNFMEIVDVQKCSEKFLPLIATILGSPPSFNSNNDLYRKVLAYALAVYKIKGTKKSYIIFLGILGLAITFVESTPAKKYTYDDDPIRLYDEEPTPNQYDSECDNCSEYWIGYSVSGGEVDQDILDAAESVLCFLQPINAKFKGWIKMLHFVDNYGDSVGDNFDIQLI